MAARYLGPRITNEGTASVEVRLRVKQANAAYYSMAGMWRAAGVKWSIKVMMYKSIYIATLTTGLCAFALRDSAYAILNREAAKKARKIPGEWGVEKGPDGTNRKKTNREVLAMMKMATMETEMRVMRLKWMQTVIRDPCHHHLYSLRPCLANTTLKEQRQ